MRIVTAAAAGLLLAACAANPKETTLNLDTTDPQFASDECRLARTAAIDYDDKVPERIIGGLALGLFLGPFGIPIAIAGDAHQNQQRELVNRQIAKSCVTGGELPLPPVTTPAYPPSDA